MPLPAYKTLGELRVELAQWLGYEADPDAVNADQMRSLCIRAQQDLWESLSGWTRSVRDFEFMTEPDVWRYPWPDTADPDRVETMYLRRANDQVHRLGEGFQTVEYDLRDDYTSWPLRYRRADMIELFPTPDSNEYTVIVRAQERLGAFAVDADRTTVPDDMVLKQAILYGRESQGRPVPNTVLVALRERVRQLRARSHTVPYLSSGTRQGDARASWPRPIISGPASFSG